MDSVVWAQQAPEGKEGEREEGREREREGRREECQITILTNTYSVPVLYALSSDHC